MNDQPNAPNQPPDDHEMPTRRVELPDTDALPLRRYDAPEDHEMPTRRIFLPDDETVLSDATPPAAPEVSPLLPRPEDIRTRTYTELPWLGTGAAPPPLPTPSTSDPERAARKRRGKKTARERRESGLYLPWWTLPILLAVVAFFVTLLLLGLNLFGGQTAPGDAEPVVIVVTSVPTTRTTELATLRPSPTALLPGATLAVAPDDAGPGVTPTFGPQGLGGILAEPPTATRPPGEIGVGVTVQVANVEGLPLNIRESAGRTAEPRFLATEGTQFVVIGGPQEVDELVWWQVQDPQDANRQGWAAQDYLAVVTQ